MRSGKGLCIVIPMKNPQDSKQRLRSVLGSNERQSLALILFNQTLNFLRQHFNTTDVLVVTPSQRIADMSHNLGARSLLEDALPKHDERDLNGALSGAALWCCEQGYSSQLILPADIVDLDFVELQQLIAGKITAPSVTICPASDGGTNALLTSPPDIIPFSYGFNSSTQHSLAASIQGIEPRLLKLEKLAFDLDTPRDYQSACGHSVIGNSLAQLAQHSHQQNRKQHRASL